jgi:hypothetical protein
MLKNKHMMFIYTIFYLVVNVAKALVEWMNELFWAPVGTLIARMILQVFGTICAIVQ